MSLLCAPQVCNLFIFFWYQELNLRSHARQAGAAPVSYTPGHVSLIKYCVNKAFQGAGHFDDILEFQEKQN